MISDLGKLFDGVDNLKDDLMEYGTLALAAVGTKIAWDYAIKFVDAKVGASLPAVVRKYGYPLAALVAASVGRKYVKRYSSQKVADGFVAGLAIVGVSGLIKAVWPAAPIAGLAGSDDDVLLGLSGGDPYARYLDSGVGSIATGVEAVNGISTSVEEVNGLADGYQPDYAAAFTQ